MHCQPVEFGSDSVQDASEDSPSGVAVAVKILQFYKREFPSAIPNHHVPFLLGNSIGILHIVYMKLKIYFAYTSKTDYVLYPAL